ncbi:Aminopeptidase 2, mitochondrial [Cyberlindnera fabianii]|uniref:Aminopeptidase n=1 Tax=Cyberlindnera fabianii TaxID=36022 RepID=A0A1V2L4A0_CYBFA|nr:Aminopeptidase 2, mitochondrial [Cyberlindnera fabianii]
MRPANVASVLRTHLREIQEEFAEKDGRPIGRLHLKIPVEGQLINISRRIPSDREVLPTNVKPTRYDLTLDPNFETFKFDGTVKIDLEVQEANTSSITLNIVEIDIHSANIGSEKTTDIILDNDKQTATFKFATPFTKGETITLEINFTGTLNDNMAGFYRSSYEENGVKKYLATTQMEPTDCRRAFPSFDEPALKAVFDITLISDKNLTALSNMDVKEVKELDNGRKATVFNSTPLMSTYLVAFIVGDLRYVESDLFRIPVRVYATPGLEQQGQFSADLTAKTLAFFEKTFGIEYPLPKIDNVAIADFSAGAMENWGLITYRVVDLLFDEKTSNLATKQRVAEVVQHELAHQWFGNLVTMDWWEGLWLNEGFATWMSWFSCNHFYPDWNVWEQYVIDSLQHAMSLDALRASHPIEVPVKKADEINQIFDAISYSKGSSLLKMISNWLGEDVFIKGVSNYLKKHKYGNTKTSDLWEALSEASGQNVVEVMDVWTKKIGFPVITVTEDAEKNQIHVKQNRYLTTGDVKPEEDETIYPVFLALKAAKGVDESIVLDSREKTLTLEGGLDFYKLNAEQVGIYRTSYSNERWEKLGKAGTDGLLSVEDRAGLVADAGALSVSGYQSTVNLLSLVNGWKEETSFVVWDEILTRVFAIKSAWVFEDKETRDALRAFEHSLVEKKAHELGWVFVESDGFLDQRLKTILFESAAACKDPKAEKFAIESFAKYIAGDKDAIHPNLRSSVFMTVARLGGVKEYEQLLSIYNNPVSPDEKITALRSLGRFEDKELIQRTLGYLFDGTVRSQDIYVPMQGMRSNAAGIEALWTWVQTNWDEITKRLPPGLSMLGSVVATCTSGFTSYAKADEIQKFFASKSTKGFDQSLAQSIDTIKSKASWVERDNSAIKAWLKENGF